ncbi:MAG: hypothetical protein LBM75_12020 [Myxococcales bacterium]|jgi:hypothetical protein|nr:hypothetical protein [Myxococcales bacterium]
MPLNTCVCILSLSILTGGLPARELPSQSIGNEPLERQVTASDGADQKSASRQTRRFVLRDELSSDVMSHAHDAHPVLLERDTASGEQRRVAGNVQAALTSPDGTLFFVQDNALFTLQGSAPRRLIERSAGDFAFDVSGNRIALVRLGDTDDATAIDLVTRDGAVERRLVDRSAGVLWLPLFTPDGQSLVYLSGETGLASFWRVDLDGQNRRQLTNQNVRPEAGGVLSQDFVPPAERRESMRFVGPSMLEFETGPERWQLDIETGVARKIHASEEDRGGTP